MNCRAESSGVSVECDQNFLDAQMFSLSFLCSDPRESNDADGQHVE